MKISEIVKQNQKFLKYEDAPGLNLQMLREFIDATRHLPEHTRILIEGVDREGNHFTDLHTNVKERGHDDLQEYLEALQEAHKEYPKDSHKDDIPYIEKDELHPCDLQTFIPVSGIMANEDKGVIQIIDNW